MGHNSVVSGHPKSIGITWVDGLSTGPEFGVSQLLLSHLFHLHRQLNLTRECYLFRI